MNHPQETRKKFKVSRLGVSSPLGEEKNMTNIDTKPVVRIVFLKILKANTAPVGHLTMVVMIVRESPRAIFREI